MDNMFISTSLKESVAVNLQMLRRRHVQCKFGAYIYTNKTGESFAYIKASWLDEDDVKFDRNEYT